MVSNDGSAHSEGVEASGSSGGGKDSGKVPLKKGPWTAAEDAVLTEYVKKNGEGNWNAVQKNSGLARCGKSCRLRWANHLRPNLKKGAFSIEEETIIVQLHAQLGNKWARMASQLPGRTDNEIKNYWNTRMKRRHRQNLPLYPPEIIPQFQIQITKPTPTHSQTQTQTERQSQSYHSQPTTPISSTPTTPATPTSSFSFHTITQLPSPTSHSHSHLLSPTASTHSPLSSPCQPVFPTLPLFDLSASTAATPAATSPFSLSRKPPVLETPLRFKRFCSEKRVEDKDNNNNNVSSSNISLSKTFSVPISPVLQSSTRLSQTNALTQLARFPSFSLTPVSFSDDSPDLMQTQFSSDPMVSPGLGYVLKQELPSNQFLSETGNSDSIFDAKLSNHINWDVSMGSSGSGSGLLEDLLEEARVLGENSRKDGCLALQDEKLGFNGFGQWGDSTSLYLSSGLKIKDESQDQIIIMHDDYTQLLNFMPSSKQTPHWFSDVGEISNGQSSVVTEDNVGAEMQQMASLFPVASKTDNGGNSGSCSWDNLPRIC